MQSERQIPVKRSDSCLFDDEFNSLHERLENDRRRMQEDINRLKQKMMNDKDRSFFTTGGGSNVMQSSKTSKTMSSTSSSSTSSTHAASNLDGIDLLKRHRTYDQPKSNGDNFEKSLIKETDEGPILTLQFDTSQYTLEEISVKTIDNVLQVRAEHTEESENRSVARKYNREFTLPKGVNPKDIRSHLSKDGILTVEAPLPETEPENQRRVPIKHL